MSDVLPCPHHTDAIYPNRFVEHGYDESIEIWEVGYRCPECLYEFNDTGRTEEEADDRALSGWNERYERTCHFRQIPGPIKGVYECSNCGYCKDRAKINYCPECGSKVVENE